MKPVRRIFLSLLLLAPVPLKAEAPPAVLGNFLKEGEVIRGQVVGVIPPQEIQKYLEKVQEASKADPEWFKEYSKKAKPGIPLPFHEKLGLSNEEYADYLALWEKREMKPVPNGSVTLQLESEGEGKWVIRTTGIGTVISLLHYDAKKDVMESPNGTLGRIQDVKADKMSILGEWTGHEWKLEEEGSLGKTKENFAIGKTGDQKYGLLIYRLQEVSATGRLIYDRSLLVRFSLPKK